MRAPAGKIIILTGQSGCGKTTLLQHMLEQLKKHPLSIQGLLSLPVEGPEGKTGIDLVDFKTGENRHLAHLRKTAGEGVFTQKWQFDSCVVEWGNLVLANACPCDLLVIDELGPLELERGEGWLNGLEALEKRNFNNAVVVIRPSLLELAKIRWSKARVFEVDRSNQSQVLEKLLNVIKSESASSVN